MTKSQIRAELRRSAMEDAEPWNAVGDDAYYAVAGTTWPEDWPRDEKVTDSHVRMFFLIVAEAL